MLHSDSIDTKIATTHPEMNTLFGDSSSSSSANSNKNNQNEDQKSSDHGEISTDPGTKSRNSTQNEINSGGIWGFQTLVKSLASKSEGIIKTYRRDLEEFGTGLKKETEALKDLTTRAVKSLQKEEILNTEATGSRVSNSSGVKNPEQPRDSDSPIKIGEPSVKVSNCAKSDRMKNDAEDEDGWGDAAEDSTGIDSVKKQSAAGNSQKVEGSRIVDIRKMMSAAAEDKDLSWDLDEDGDDAKSAENH